MRLTQGTIRKGRRYLDYKETVGWAYKAKHAGREPMVGKLSVRVTIWMTAEDELAVKWDLDNVAKAILDGLNAIAFADDSAVYELYSVHRILPEDWPDQESFVSVLLAPFDEEAGPDAPTTD